MIEFKREDHAILPLEFYSSRNSRYSIFLLHLMRGILSLLGNRLAQMIAIGWFCRVYSPAPKDCTNSPIFPIPPASPCRRPARPCILPARLYRLAARPEISSSISGLSVPGLLPLYPIGSAGHFAVSAAAKCVMANCSPCCK